MSFFAKLIFSGLAAGALWSMEGAEQAPLPLNLQVGATLHPQIPFEDVNQRARVLASLFGKELGRFVKIRNKSDHRKIIDLYDCSKDGSLSVMTVVGRSMRLLRLGEQTRIELPARSAVYFACELKAEVPVSELYFTMCSEDQRIHEITLKAEGESLSATLVRAYPVADPGQALAPPAKGGALATIEEGEEEA